MQLRLLISISLLALALQKICAQSADDFFHGGARAYLTNNTASAQEQVDKGLKLFPDDVKLKKLDELLKQQKQQQQQQQNQQQQDKSKQDQSQSKQDQQKQSDQQKQDQEKKDQEKKDQQNQQPKPDQQSEQDKDKDKDQQIEQQAKPGQMTPDQAKQLLDSQKNDEALLPSGRQEKSRDRQHPLKDW